MIVCDMCGKTAIYYSVVARLSDKNFQQKDFCEDCYNGVQAFIEDCKHGVEAPKQETLKLKPKKALLK